MAICLSNIIGDTKCICIRVKYLHVVKTTYNRKYQIMPLDDISIPLKANVLFLLQISIIHIIIHGYSGYF